jgi:hypothetical protein
VGTAGLTFTQILPKLNGNLARPFTLPTARQDYESLHGRRRWCGAQEWRTAMAVKLSNRTSGKTGRGTAMALALAALALPSAALAQDQDGGRRGGWNRGGEAAGNINPSGGEQRRERAARSNEGGGDQGRRAWGAPQQRMAAPQQAQVPQAQMPQAPQVRWQGNGASWQGRNAGQTAPVATPPANWSGNDQNRGDRRGGWNGERRGSDARTGQPGRQDRTTSQPSTTQDRRWNGNRAEWNTGRQGQEAGRRDNDRQDSNRWDGNRERRDGERWREGDRDRRGGTYWNGGNATNQNRYRDTNRYVHRDGRNWNRWNNGWRSNNRYDWSSYRRTNPSIYRWGSYYSPYRGYSYRRLSIGLFLDNLFYSNRYWINDPWQYRLPDAYGPYRWVRYYDDALLVDTYTGEVVDVIYDFFW